MSMFREREILGSSHNIMRNGLHFTNIALEVPVSLAETVNDRKIIKAGIIVAKDGTKAITTGSDGAKTSNAYGVIYENIDVTYEQKTTVFVPVVIHGVIDERLLPTAPTAEDKKALTGIQFTDGE